jgi:MoaA/NifB/PqqE/SkfB family radical SAM enzyme
MQSHPSGIVYEITQDCPFKCPICLRHHNTNERRLNIDEREILVRRLKQFGIGRITITGGEPTILGDELYNFMKLVHREQIHSCLCTSGLGITENNLLCMNEYVDQILLSVRSFNLQEWIKEYGNISLSKLLYQNVLNILKWSQNTQIILVVNLVVHKNNMNGVIDFGKQLAEINNKLTWRITEYYGIGLGSVLRTNLEITDDEFSHVRETVIHKFKDVFTDLIFISKRQLAHSPEYVISPSGNLITTNNYSIHTTEYNLITGPVPQTIQSPRPWSAFVKACRDWGWKDF